MKGRFAVARWLIFSATLLLSPPSLAAQRLEGALRLPASGVAAGSEIGRASPSPVKVDASAPVPVLLLGGAAGGVVGFFGGAVAGAGIAAMMQCSGEWCGLSGAVLGAAAGETLGVPFGAHLANRRRGRLTPSIVSSVLIAAGGLYLVSSTDNESWLWAIPVAQLWTAAQVERNTSSPAPVPVPTA